MAREGHVNASAVVFKTAGSGCQYPRRTDIFSPSACLKMAKAEIQLGRSVGNTDFSGRLHGEF
jgi:hypothetical protein